MTEFENPMGTDGFAFMEFTSPDSDHLIRDFKKLGFTQIAKHPNRDITLYRQGDIQFLMNLEPSSKSTSYAKAHGPSVCGMGFRVQDAKAAYAYALKQGAKPFEQQDYPYLAIEGIGGSAIYLVDQDIDWQGSQQKAEGVGLTYIDHCTHNVHQGQMDVWYNFYERIFNFREIRYFDIKGKMTGLISRALTSPCGKIRIPLNEGTDANSQIEEFLRDYNGEGIQHIALGSDDIYHSTESLRNLGIEFLDVPDTYYDMIKPRVPWHEENVPRLMKNKILLDGDKEPVGGLLLQLFTHNMLGPVFFEIIQRKGNQGFGEGNFRALFEAIERDQIERGVIKEA